MISQKLPDLIIVVVYLVGIAAFGVWVGRKSGKSTEGYFLAGRNLSWTVIGFSLFATNISLNSFVGGNGMAYRIGIASFVPELTGGLMLTFSAVFFIPIFLRSKIFTIPQFLERRYNRSSKLLLGILLVCQSLLLTPLYTYTAALAALGLFGYEISPTSLILTAFTITSLVGVYSITGGLTSVVITDVVQVMIMIIGGLAVAVFGIIKIGGLGELYSEDMFTLLRPADDPYLPWNAIIPGQLINATFFACASYGILQRALGAKSVEHAQKGILLGAFLKMFSVLVLAIPGIVAAKLYPGANPDATYTMMVGNLLPVGFTGLLMAGLLAALMSSQDSGINALSSLVALDILPAFKPNVTEKQAITVGKFFAGGTMLWGVLAAPAFLLIDQSIFDLVRKFTGFVILPIGVCFLFGRFSRRVNHQGAMATLASGLVFGMTYISFTTVPQLKVHLPTFIAEAHYYQVYPFFFVLFSAILFAVSHATPAPSVEQLKVLEFATDPKPTTTPQKWYRRYGFWWSLYLACFVGLFLTFN